MIRDNGVATTDSNTSGRSSTMKYDIVKNDTINDV